jgi:hypothetical protein
MKKLLLAACAACTIIATSAEAQSCRYFPFGWYRYNRVTGTVSSRSVAARVHCGNRRPGTWVYFSGGTICRGEVLRLKNGRQRYSCRISSVWGGR